MKTNDIIESLNLSAANEKPIANGLLNQIADALQERDAAIAALRQIGQAVDAEASQLENWIAGQVDGVLNDDN